MAIQITKVDVWAGEIQDQPGSTADVLQALAEAGAEIECVIARRQAEKPGTGVIFVSPIKGKKAQAAARAAGLSSSPNLATLRIEAPYRPDAGAKVGRAIEAAGINVRGVTGVKVGKNLVAYIGFDSDDDAKKAMKALQKMI